MLWCILYYIVSIVFSYPLLSNLSNKLLENFVSFEFSEKVVAGN